MCRIERDSAEMAFIFAKFGSTALSEHYFKMYLFSSHLHISLWWKS